MAIDLERVAQAPFVPLAGIAWRHISPHHPPRSGEGARLHGGRFNPPESFPVLYLCQSRPCAVAELARLGVRQAIGVEGLLPRSLYRYELRLQRVLDLTVDTTRGALGIDLESLTASDWRMCQAVGPVAHSLGIQAINSPSATGVGEVLALITEHVDDESLKATLVEEWRVIGDVKP